MILGPATAMKRVKVLMGGLRCPRQLGIWRSHRLEAPSSSHHTASQAPRAATHLVPQSGLVFLPQGPHLSALCPHSDRFQHIFPISTKPCSPPVLLNPQTNVLRILSLQDASLIALYFTYN